MWTNAAAVTEVSIRRPGEAGVLGIKADLDGAVGDPVERYAGRFEACCEARHFIR
ncbi:9e829012-e216-430b-a38e-8155f85b5b78 [Thermothielavioides terrestris]|uniref:9e829012-e216-430b-a38e-8155f85b5b78 n=1 Tax=Thermothielavioides terrestris TaxID=2587410 RepID=A0A3S4D0U6_9PEZI|nr:9e829012-e216-430b-a38e-8155f85b5b78 [Thermothielavioides terrestris]